LAATFTFLLLAQAGVPFTSGFYAKFYAVIAAVGAQSAWLAVVAMLSAVVAAYLYLRVVVSMWFHQPGPETPTPGLPIAVPTGIALVVCTAVTLFIGIAPGPLTSLVDRAEPALVEPAAAGGGGPATAIDPGLLELFGGQPDGQTGGQQPDPAAVDTGQ